MIKLIVTTTNGISGTTRIGTINSKYAPAVQAFISSSATNIVGFVNTDGEAYIRDSSGTTHGSGYLVDMWLTYMTA